jgi:predicted N-acetyltransferase YhbS
MGAGLPGVYIMATLPAWGRRGLGKAIMARIVSEAAAAGHPMLTLTAGDQGYGLYRQFGFEHLFDYSIFSV